MIKKVVVEADGTIIITKEERRKISWLDISHGQTYDTLNMDLWKLLTEKGFQYLVYGWHGFGYARNLNGLWYEVDIKERKIGEKPIGTSLPDSFLLGHIVSEQDWGKWALEIPLERKGIFA